MFCILLYIKFPDLSHSMYFVSIAIPILMHHAHRNDAPADIRPTIPVFDINVRIYWIHFVNRFTVLSFITVYCVNVTSNANVLFI